MKPLVIDLFCGLGGWSQAFLNHGFRAVGFDIERHDYGTGGYPGELVLRDVRSLTGTELVKQYGVPACIVASPPCQEFSYMAMPWTKAKEKRRKILADPAEQKRLTDLFNQCFRIQREVVDAAGHYVPIIIENVRGAQEWVGKARWNFGSFYLWGDVPALMPIPGKVRKTPDGSWDASRTNYNPDHQWEGTKHGPSMGKVWSDRPPSVSAHREKTGFKSHGLNWSDQTKRGQDFTRVAGKQTYAALKEGVKGFTPNGEPLGKNTLGRMHGSQSNARKKASAEIAKIPAALAEWIAKCFKQAA